MRLDQLGRPVATVWAKVAMSGAGFKPDSILTQAKNNNAAGIRALVEAGVPVEFCNQVGSNTRDQASQALDQQAVGC